METPPTTTTTDSPPSNTLTKQLLPPPLTNGVLKRHHPPPPLLVVASYKECLKNHAAAIGGHAIDGCGEFMPSPSSSPRHPTSLTCAACGCHRNFHRREPDESLNYHLSPPIQHLIEYQPHNRHHPPPPPQPPQPNSDSPVSPPPISSSYYPSAPHIALALTTVYPTDNHHIQPIPTSCGKKRFRTKFTQDQKVKMHDIAERIDWKIQKQDEDMIIAFCDDIGVDKNVFKVWMHNNKTTSGIKKIDHVSISSGDNGIDFIISRNNHHQQDNNNNNNHNNGGNVICAKASSSSS